MNHSSERVLRYLAGNENIEDISVDDLQKLVDESPYFPVSRFFLAKKLKAENDADFLPQIQKTALYFSNSLWLHYQLDEPIEIFGNETDLLEDKIQISQKPVATAFISNEEELFSEKEAKPESISENETVQETKESLENTTNKKEQDAIVNENVESSLTDAALHSEKKRDQQEEEMAAITRDTDDETGQFLDETGSLQPLITDNSNEVLTETRNAAVPEITEFLEEMAGASRETNESTEVFLNEAFAETNATQPFSETAIPDSDAGEENEKEQNTEQDEHEKMFQNIKAMLDATSEEADADVENTFIPIDPYYTIDYFASQGIKLELDPNPKDELGQHLKKFTQWLKHMKKLGPEDATEVIARTETEADIQKIADSSNTVREVVTEAMASVLEKQGKKDKAIELYKKLSFLNPDKSTYFAGKIKNLKGI